MTSVSPVAGDGDCGVYPESCEAAQAVANVGPGVKSHGCVEWSSVRDFEESAVEVVELWFPSSNGEDVYHILHTLSRAEDCASAF